MKKIKKYFFKLASYFLVCLILFFLIKNLLNNTQQLENFNFSFNYLYLILSILLLLVGEAGYSLVWRKILMTFESDKQIKLIDGLRIYMVAEFGKYLPGKVWSVLGRVALAKKYGFSTRFLFLSAILDAGLSTMASLFLGGLLVFWGLGNVLPNLYFLSAIILIGGLTVVHPKIFYPIFNYGLKILKRQPLDNQATLTYTQILKFFIYYIMVCLVQGLAFLLLVKAIVAVSWLMVPAVIGVYLLAVGVGVLALLAPSGLGVREGIFVLVLNFYLPVAVATIISFLARLWFTSVELLLLGMVYLFSFFKKSEKI